MLVLMGKLILLLDVIKDTFKDFSSKEKDIIELYSKIDTFIIDDLGTERISSWALEKLYQFCYGIELKKYHEYEKEKVSISDQTKY